jgi:hypothetical protein
MYCDPERLSALQRVFDAVWLAARVRNKPGFLSHPDKLRDDIAYCVMSCAKLDMKHDDILLAGLELLELTGGSGFSLQNRSVVLSELVSSEGSTSVLES